MCVLEGKGCFATHDLTEHPSCGAIQDPKSSKAKVWFSFQLRAFRALSMGSSLGWCQDIEILEALILCTVQGRHTRRETPSSQLLKACLATGGSQGHVITKLSVIALLTALVSVGNYHLAVLMKQRGCTTLNCHGLSQKTYHLKVTYLLPSFKWLRVIMKTNSISRF